MTVRGLSRIAWVALAGGRTSLLRSFPSRALATASQGRIISSPVPDIVLEDATIDNYIWKHINKWPDLVAVECGQTGRKYTFAQVEKQCRRFATVLRALGARHGDTLALMLPNCPEFPVTFIGAFHVGLRINPINPVYTADEVCHQLKEADSKLLVCTPASLSIVLEATSKLPWPVKLLVTNPLDGSALPSLPKDVLPLQQLLDDGPIDDRKVDMSTDEVAVVPFSSGTTGLPKGVMLTHNNIVSNIQQYCLTCERVIPTEGTRQDIIPAVLPFFHCYGQVVIMLQALLKGSKLVTFPRFDPKMFVKVLESHKRDLVLFCAPPIVFFLGSSEMVTKETLKGVRLIMSGAAPCSSSDIEQLHKKTDAGFIQGFGMTESSPVLTVPIGIPSTHDTVGVPVVNTLAKVICVETGELLPPNTPGELCFKGPQVMKGYLNNPKATAETLDSEGWLHTGDIGYYSEDNHFFITDRLKELIKVKGFQVAPAELEALLRSHAAVIEAGVVGKQMESGEESPVGFVSLRSGPAPTSEELLEFVNSKVAPYKRLKQLNIIPEVPKSLAGKILRKELKKIAQGK